MPAHNIPLSLAQAFTCAGAAGWGTVAYDRLAKHMSTEQQDRAASLCPNSRAVLVAAFPYYAGEHSGNLSLYTHGLDYHRIVADCLNPICTLLQQHYPEDSFIPTVDTSPLPEKQAAWMAGLGLCGKNGLFILPPYGSYLFLGTILTSAPLDTDETAPVLGCLDCGRCIRACPSGALSEHGVVAERCLSHLSQQKRDLTAEEKVLLARHPLIWGCDICQMVCPHNRDVPHTAILGFSQNLLTSLELTDLEVLSKKQFETKYAGRAFTWRGPEVLRRNLRLQQD